MSSRVVYFSSDDVEHLSNGFGKMGREYKSSHGSNHNGFICNSRSGWDDDDDVELKEEDVWGTTASCNHTYDETSNAGCAFQSATENGGSTKGSNGRKSWLSLELQAVGIKGQKKESVGVGFAVFEAVQNGGMERNGGWAPGFSARKVKIPPYMGGGAGGSGCGNGWHEHNTGQKRGGVPQSAPVSMSIWPAKCGFGESTGGADVDDSDCENDDDRGSEGDGDEDGESSVRLAPHEIVDRDYARSQVTTFSVIEGAGRTLKGMDLRRVRNAVWSRTGFED